MERGKTERGGGWRGRSVRRNWLRLDECVQTTGDGHMLRDMAQVDLRVPQPLVPPEDSEGKVCLLILDEC